MHQSPHGVVAGSPLMLQAPPQQYKVAVWPGGVHPPQGLHSAGQLGGQLLEGQGGAGGTEGLLQDTKVDPREEPDYQDMNGIV